MKRIYWIIIAALIVIFALVAFGTKTYIDKTGKIEVSMTVEPSDAEIFVDDKKVSNPAYVTPGLHTFVAKKDGFKDTLQRVDISPERNKLILLPEPSSIEAWKWANEPKTKEKLAALADEGSNVRGLSLSARYPIIDKLPYYEIAGPFSIDYGYEGVDNSHIYLIIHDSTPDGRRNALEWIRAQNVDPTDLDIRYDEYKNPLTNTGNN